MEQDTNTASNSVTTVKYVGAFIAKQLEAAGITTVEQLATVNVETLAAIKGVGTRLAPSILQHARVLMGLEDPASIVTERKTRAPRKPKTLPKEAVVSVEETTAEAVSTEESAEAVPVQTTELVVDEDDSDLIQPSPKVKTADKLKKATKKAQKAVAKAKKAMAKAEKAQKKAEKALKKEQKLKGN